MGQTESAENEDENCFRACMKESKSKSKKMQALPYYQQKRNSGISGRSPQHQNPFPLGHAQPISFKDRNLNTDTFETSIDHRLAIDQAKLKKKNSVQNSTNIVTYDPKDAPVVQGSADTTQEIVLGLQSKFSSTKNTYQIMASRTHLTKANVEANTAGTRCSSHEKQSGSQTEITTKSNQTSTSTRSRNILMNKIQQIKQKYYERELEIEICTDEREYQHQIDQINHIDKTFVDAGELPEQSLGEIKAIRNKILAKLREKKDKNKVKEDILPNNIEDHSLHITVNQSLTVHDHLELYSKEGKVLFQDTLIESQTLKKSKRTKNNLSFSGKPELNKSLSRSLNTSHPQCSLDQKMEFSEYSEESLHEIRELDEEYEDYRSKMTGPSAIFKNHLNSLKPSKNSPSDLRKQSAPSKCSKGHTIIHFQQEENDQQSPCGKVHGPEMSQQSSASKASESSSQVSSYKRKQSQVLPANSKSNKILLF